MYSNADDQIQETKRQHVRLTRQLLGVLDEDQYFARLEVERRRKSFGERTAKLLAEEREQRRTLHYMNCPKCGMELEEIPFGDVRVDRCFSCEGLWLDKGELEIIRLKEGGFMAQMLSVFR